MRAPVLPPIDGEKNRAFNLYALRGPARVARRCSPVAWRSAPVRFGGC